MGGVSIHSVPLLLNRLKLQKKARLQNCLNKITLTQLLMSFLQGASFDEFMSVTRPGKNSCPDNKTSF